MADYHENIVRAKFTPAPAELFQLRSALRGNDEDTKRFIMAREGLIPPEEFFNTENLERIRLGVDSSMAALRGNEQDTNHIIMAREARFLTWTFSIAAAVNTIPPAVAIGPPSVIVPVVALERKLPNGTSQTFFPSDKSTAAIVPHGGALQGSPLGESSGVRNIAKGAPVCGANSPCNRSVCVAFFRAGSN